AGDPLSATVTALKPGVAEIRVTADNGVNAAYALTVLCPHTNTRVEGASDPGCETPGSTGRLICSDCGEVIREAQPISALGHDWGAVEYVWANDLSTCTATHVCKRDPSHVETENAVITAIVTKAPGYVHYGEHTYSAGFTVPAFITQTRVVADVAPLPVDFVWGDADGSGVVDTADLIRLANYLSGATVEIFPGADANGDDATDEADLARLTAYFADYDFANETPGVILGPDNA
ncbi:MAG: dockerin type I repeat-containing protein, partial [Clostridia bacterium]|nr:dockerin type I repeat-containing protein [Clostridia bacterium]